MVCCAAAGRGTATKVLHCVRHGATEMTAYLALHKYGSPHQEPLRDPMLYDTVLTRTGTAAAVQLAREVAELWPRPEVVLTSPLTRCLQTAVLACQELQGGAAAPTIEAEPLLRERAGLSSEVGRPPRQLQQDFPRVSFPAGMPDVWWYSGEAEGPASASGLGSGAQTVSKEPEGLYLERLEELRRVLAQRPERCLLLVSHWGVLSRLAGCDLQPGQLVTVELEL